MTFLYLIEHTRSGLSVLGISILDPLSTYGFNNQTNAWKKLMHRYRLSKNDLSTALKITVLQQSDDKNVLKQWLKHYYKIWDVFNNPSFIYSNKRYLYYKKYHIRKRRRKHIHKSTNISKITGLIWYTDGFKNIRLKPNTNPPVGFKRGCTQKKSRKPFPSINKRACISPSGERFDSLKEAAAAYDLWPGNILTLIQRGVSGWHYADDKKFKPRPNKLIGNTYYKLTDSVPKAVRDPNGIVYPSINDAARQYDLTAAGVKYRIKKWDGWEFVTV